MENSSSSFTSESLENVRKGQRLMIFGVLANFVSLGLNRALEFPELGLGAILLGVIIFCIVGIVKVVFGLRLSIFWAVFGGLAMFIPLLNLIVLLILSGKASTVLKAHGYEVGLLGASKK